MFGWGCGFSPHAPIIQSTLVALNSSFDIVADLADEWHWEDERMTLSMHVRDDAFFSDGSEVVADDVAFTLNNARQSDRIVVDLSPIESVEVADDRTVLIHLSRPSHTLLFSLCFIGIVPASTYDEISYGTNPVGSGPYTIANWDRGERIELEANPRYYGPVSMKRITVLFQSEDGACGSCYNDQVDIAWTSPRLSDQSINGFSLLDSSSVDVYGISLPIGQANGSRVLQDGRRIPAGNAVTSDTTIRRALCNGIDRKALVRNALQGYGVAAFTPVTNSPWNNDDITMTSVNADDVRNQLTANGWALGNDGFRTRNGERAAMTLYCPSDMHNMRSPAARQISKEFVSQAKSLGIDVTIAYADGQTIDAQKYVNPVVCEWHSGLPYELQRAFASRSDDNLPGYAQGVTDDYLEQAEAAGDLDTAIGLWKKAQWDGRIGPCAQGSAAYSVLCTSDQMFYKRASLDVGVRARHTTMSGWSLLANAHTWTWDR